MDRLAFDIETQGNPDRLSSLPEPEVATGNLKDPEKIAAKVAEAKAAAADKAALDPHWGRVIAISVAHRAKNTDEIIAETHVRLDLDGDRDTGERALLRWFWERANHCAGRVLTYNGCRFDVPFLVRRSMILRVKPLKIETSPYRTITPNDDHFDLYQVLAEQGPHSICSRTLKYYVKELLGEECPYGDLDKGELGRLFEAKQYEIIQQVCSWDCQATLRLGELVEDTLR